MTISNDLPETGPHLLSYGDRSRGSQENRGVGQETIRPEIKTVGERTILQANPPEEEMNRNPNQDHPETIPTTASVVRNRIVIHNS